MIIKPIETVYRGYKFRSRLEAKWGVFLDACEVKWKYEEEGYDLHYSGYYLPDFHLPTHRVFIEIKPLPKHSHDGGLPFADRMATRKCAELSFMFPDHRILLSFGDPLDHRVLWYENGILEMTKCAVFFDKGDPELVNPVFYEGQIITMSEPGIDQDDPWIERRTTMTYEGNRPAALFARQAKFEHGENPDLTSIKDIMEIITK